MNRRRPRPMRIRPLAPPIETINGSGHFFRTPFSGPRTGTADGWRPARLFPVKRRCRNCFARRTAAAGLGRLRQSWKGRTSAARPRFRRVEDTERPAQVQAIRATRHMPAENYTEAIRCQLNSTSQKKRKYGSRIAALIASRPLLQKRLELVDIVVVARFKIGRVVDVPHRSVRIEHASAGRPLRLVGGAYCL